MTLPATLNDPIPLLMLLEFDHHATTPLDPRVLEAMLPYFGEKSGTDARSSRIGTEPGWSVIG